MKEQEIGQSKSAKIILRQLKAESSSIVGGVRISQHLDRPLNGATVCNQHMPRFISGTGFLRKIALLWKRSKIGIVDGEIRI